MPETSITRAWSAIFEHYGIDSHDFSAPFFITARQIKESCQHFTQTGEREVRILCKLDTREERPQVFIDNGLFLLAVKNGKYTKYAIIKGEGYVDIPPIHAPLSQYRSEFPFELETTKIGDSEMQHLDRAYALSLIRHFVGDRSLVLTIRGRKFTPEFNFYTGGFLLNVKGVQTEVDAGYEGENQVVLIEAKGGKASNTIIRQIYYPFRQWQMHTTKRVSMLFFQQVSRGQTREYHIWQFVFDDPENYNSIRLEKSARYEIITAHEA